MVAGNWRDYQHFCKATDWMEPEFKGFLDGSGFLVPCHKNEKGDFEIITEDQQIQVVPSAANEVAVILVKLV